MSSVPSPKSMMAANRGPTVFFEHAVAMSCTNGVYCLTLAAGSPIPLQDGRLGQELIGVGQIHGTRHALTELRIAIDRILNVKLPHELDPHGEGSGRSRMGSETSPKH
ncbi:hypothetical protein [Bosea sp. ASV33]|uniref:hypothetical protein n=1 Tax=Bosea sp. ASV33 TaxID=2795106 RepID=UPI0018ECA0EA|nr:hypothetical protein [Bosea sp. ASV33]